MKEDSIVNVFGELQEDFIINQKFIEENVEYITILNFAQYIQEISFEEVKMLVKNMIQFRDKYLTDKTLPMCSKIADEILLEDTCAMQEQAQEYNFMHYCNRADFERGLCFFHNKKKDAELLPPLPTLGSEEKCQTCKNTENLF
ncbi:afamin-like [Talpa occidentalis]|uniref:afamin-like n=1 Tax=Talpa occidentalis TaxID=50954 RepID=UPI00188FC734|nr:afamin-like [Talpa occidentalis]